LKLLKGKRWKSVVCASKFPRAAGLVLAGEREPPVGVKRVARGPFRRASVRVSSAGGRTAGGSLFLPRQVHAPGCSRLSAGLRPRNVGNTRPFWRGFPSLAAIRGRIAKVHCCCGSWSLGGAATCVFAILAKWFSPTRLVTRTKESTYMRVFGWQTLMRNESEGQRWLAEV